MTLRLPRRRFLEVVGLQVAGLAALAACGDRGSSDTPNAATGGGMTDLGAGEGSSVLVALFSTDRVIAAGSSQRLPIAVFGPERTPRRDDALPATTTARVTRDGTEIATETVELHGRELPFPYYPIRTTLPEPGLYDVAVDLDDGPAGLIVQAFDPAEVVVPQVGDLLPAVPTPTVEDPRGVDPLCTRFEPCPFHSVSLDAALGGAPVALLVGTPAYCQTGVCGPTLEQLIAAAPAHPGTSMIHAEVYANPREVEGNLADPAIRSAPIIEALGLTFEPVLFLVGSDGRVAHRFDNVFDRAELDAALEQLT